MIVDSQIHVWEAESPDRPWPVNTRRVGHRLDDPAGVDEILGQMDAAGIDGAVLIPPSFAGDWNDTVSAAVRDYPNRFVGMGRIGLDIPRSSAWIREELDKSNLLGFRLTFLQEDVVSRLRAGELNWFWTACSELDVPVMVFGPDVPDLLEDIAQSHPTVRLAIDHLNLYQRWPLDVIDRKVDDICRLARYENVSVKASALPCNVELVYPFPGLAPIVYRTIEAFGVERVFWGSDLTRLPCSYAEWRDFFLHNLDELIAPEKAEVMGQALVRWLGVSVETFGQ